MLLNHLFSELHGNILLNKRCCHYMSKTYNLLNEKGKHCFLLVLSKRLVHKGVLMYTLKEIRKADFL